MDLQEGSMIPQSTFWILKRKLSQLSARQLRLSVWQLDGSVRKISVSLKELDG